MTGIVMLLNNVVIFTANTMLRCYSFAAKVVYNYITVFTDSQDNKIANKVAIINK